MNQQEDVRQEIQDQIDFPKESACCGSSFIEDSDVCSKCKEHSEC